MKKSLYSIKEINSLFDRLFPLNRSILGEGYRKSLEILCEYIPFNLLSYPTGKQVQTTPAAVLFTMRKHLLSV